MVLSDQIKLQTRIQHQELEGVLVPKIKAVRSKEDYASLLQLFYLFFNPLEKDIGALMDSRLPDFDQRRKTGSILKDLNFIEHKWKSPTPKVVSPDIQNFPQALGALYVMEGSTLGGRIIAKIIGQQLNLPPETGLSYFEAYGDATEKMWNQFLQLLNDPDFSLLERESVVFSAKSTFIHFTSLVKQHYRV